jgi:phosphoribosylaminoimidazolecarboxamide formyltransferase/IMP cyclohydrolase
MPTEQEYRDMWFGWLVESGITSNSVIYVKDGVTVGIGTGEQDRVGVAEFARDKAHTKLKDRLCWEREKISYNELVLKIEKLNPSERGELKCIKDEIDFDVERSHGGLEGAVAVSDAFFPARDGVDVVLREGVKAIIQPGGSEKDYEVIEACNEKDATMVFTGQRSFKH